MAETRTRRHRHIVVIGAAFSFFIVAAAVVSAVLWAVACRRLDDGTRQAVAAAGWTLSTGPARWGGWPFTAEVALPDAALRAGPDIIPPVAWTAGRVVLRLPVLHPSTLALAAAGPQTLAIGAAPPVPFTARSLEATVDLAERDPVVAAAAGVEIASPTGPITIDAAALRLLPGGVAADLSGMTFPGPGGRPVEPAIATLSFDGEIAPPVPAGPTAAASAQAWRAAGGRLVLSGVALRWGTLEATGQATVTLDVDLQPALSGRVSSTGLGGILDQLVRSGAMTDASATAARGMLAILSAPSGGGPLTLPVMVRDGVVSIARVPLLRLAPLQWD